MLRKGPWNFDRSLLLIREFDGNLQMKDICIIEVSFWIRVYDLPLMARNEYVYKLVGDTLGQLEEADLDHGEVEWGEFMRLRVGIDIKKRILRRKHLNIALMEPVWVCFLYERLPDLCFYYGVLGHSHRECHLWTMLKDKCEKDGFPYKNWLKAGPNGGGGGSAKQGSKPLEPNTPVKQASQPPRLLLQPLCYQACRRLL